MAEETNVPEGVVDKLSEKSEFIGPAQIGANLYKPLLDPGQDIHALSHKGFISNPALGIKDTTTGSAPTINRPVPAAKGPKSSGLKAEFDKLRAQLATNVDKNAYSKIYAYDSSPKGAHKARYKAYGQKTYDEIGFSPEIDNETWFNANTSMYDDWKRMATNAAWPMMKLGFMSPIKSYGKLFGQADIGQDLAEARDYEEYNAIGYSTKGGIGGFAINLQNSAAYSVGILAEGIIEGMAIGAAVGAIGGEGVGAAPGAVLGGITEGISSLFKLPSTLINMTKSLGKMTMNLKKMENINSVRSMFTNAGKSMGNFINPISNTSEAAMKYVFKNPDDLSNLARTGRTVGAVWHDIKNINLALSEGRLEGGFTEQNTYDRLYNEYYNKYGEAPTDNLQKSMRKQAKVAGFQNTWKNTMLVHYSNNIAFPSITKAGFLKGLPTFSKTAGKIGPYQLIVDPAKRGTGALFSYEEVSLRNAAKALTKPATYGKTALNYFKANLVEGFQETAQDVLSAATEDYYVNSFQNKDRQNFDYSMATLNSAMKKQVSAQGLETFASGFAMGSILSIPGSVKDFLSVGYNKYYKHRNDYDTYLQERETEVKDIIGALNTIDQNADHLFDPRLNNYVTQMLVGKVADEPDDNSTKDGKDASFAGFASAVRTALRSGTFDLFIDNFEGYKQASAEEIEQAWRLEPGQGEKALRNIDSAISTAKSMASRWQGVKNKFKHVVDPNQFAQNTPEREIADIYNHAYLTGLDNIVFMGAAFDNNAGRLEKMYNKLSSLPTIQNSRFADFAGLTESDRLQKEIAMLRTDIDLSKDALTPEAKTQHEKQKVVLEKLESFQKEQQGATVDFLKRIMSTQKSIMESETGLSANEAQAKAVEQVVAEYKNEGLQPFTSYRDSFQELLKVLAGNDQNQIKLSKEIDDAGGIDVLFDTLMDTHILRNENANLNKFINLLNDPKEFYEHVQRNFDWMKKLYDSRQDYYEDVVNNSLIAIQRNTLLEDLASEGIYVDLEEFAEWCKDNKNLPSYFIDQVNNRIINEDSYLYDKYIDKFQDASNAESTNPPIRKSEADIKLQRAIDNYNVQREGELKTVREIYDRELKELLGYTQDEIEKMRNDLLGDNDLSEEEIAEQSDFIKDALLELQTENTVEVEAIFELAFEQKVLDSQSYNAAKEDLFADENSVQEAADIARKFLDADETGELTDDEAMDAALNVLVLGPLLEARLDVLEKYKSKGVGEGIPSFEETKPYLDYTAAVEEINKKYDSIIENLIAEFQRLRKEAIDSGRPEVMVEAIQKVKDLFSEQEDIVQTERNYIKDGEPHQRMSNRIKTGYDTYNYTGETALSDLFDATLGAALSGRPSGTTQKYSDKDVSVKRETFELNNLGIKTVIRGTTKLDGSIEWERQPDGVNWQAEPSYKFKTIEEMKDGLTDEDSTVKRIKEEDYTKIQNPQLFDRLTYDQQQRVDAKRADENTEEPREFDQDMIDDFMAELEAENLPGVNTNKFTIPIVRDALETLIAPKGTRLTKKTQKNIARLQEQLAKIEEKLATVTDTERLETLEKQKTALEAAIKDEETGKYDPAFEMTIDNIKSFVLNTVKENAYQESRDGGNTVDNMLKDFLDTDTSTKPPFDSTLMTKEAYDALFDDETGYLTKFKEMADNGEIFIFTKNLIVYDNTLVDEAGNKLPSVAGEIDMIIVDREGKVFIVDLKTGKLDKWLNYKVVGSNSYKKQLENTLQQTGYANLAFNMSGIDFGIKIFPIETGFDDDGKLVSAGMPTNPALFVGEEVVGDEGTEPYTITLNGKNVIQVKKEGTSIYETTSIDNFMGKLIPRKATPNTPKKRATPVSTASIPESERGFVDDFMSRLASSGEDLVEEEEVRSTPSANPSPTLGEVVGKTVYYNGKPYVVQMEGEKYVLNSPTTIIELEARGDELLTNIGIDYYQGKPYESKYSITINSENSVTVDGVNYTVSVDDVGNITGLSPENRPEQIIKNEKLIVAVEIERNKSNFRDSAANVEDIDYNEALEEVRQSNPADQRKVLTVENVFNKNMNDTIDSALTKLYSNQELTDGEKLALDLWVTEAWMDLSKINDKVPHPIYQNALDNLEIINTLLYEGYTEKPTKAGTNVPTQRRFKAYKRKTSPKRGKSVTTEPVQESEDESEQTVDPISDDVFDSYMDTGNIPKSYIREIALSIIDNYPLSQRQMVIFMDLTGEINEMILKMSMTDNDATAQTKTKRTAFDDITELYEELEKKRVTLSAESYDMLREQLDIRASLLFDDTGDIVLRKGEMYIFTDVVKGQSITKGFVGVIESFDPIQGTVTLYRNGKGSQETVTMNINDFIESAMSMQDIDNYAPEDNTYNPTPEEVEHITESMDNLNDDLSDYTQRIKWNTEASDPNISTDQLKDDFFTNFKC